MADIFISYASVDRPAARRLAEALEARGWSVWWDDRSLYGGQHFERVIEEAISSAKVVIVIWSRHSVRSDWVMDEAALALNKRKLVPLRIDMATLPFRFRTIHTLDLSSWTGESGSEAFERLLKTLSHYLGPPSSSNEAEQPDRRAEARSQAEPTDAAASLPKRKPIKPYVLAALATAGLLMLGVGVAMLGERQEVPSPRPPAEATVPKPPASTRDVIADMKAAYERGDYEAALSLARPAAEQGNAQARNNLGLMYDEGHGVPRDDSEAARWYRKAAEQGYAIAEYNLALMYEQGRGVPRDDAEAARWYRKAAEQGNAEAQSNLGGMYREGHGVPRDDAEAARWFRKAAEQGYANAEYDLGVMYEQGWGVPRDDAEAVRWYRKAAEQGDANAENNLGGMYAQGHGVPRDDAEAARWFRKAAEQGHGQAQANLDRLSARQESPWGLLYRLFE